MKIPEGKLAEKYFHIKLKNQLGYENSFSNIKIKISEFIDDLNIYMCCKVFKSDKLDKKSSDFTYLFNCLIGKGAAFSSVCAERANQRIESSSVIKPYPLFHRPRLECFHFTIGQGQGFSVIRWL